MKKLIALFILTNYIVSQSFAQSFSPTFSWKLYLPKEYKASGQNWNAIHDSNGSIYFANKKGILFLNGFSWQLIPFTVSNQGEPRALAINKSGRIYAGGLGEFGYLATDSTGKPAFVSIINKVENEKNIRNKTISAIVTIADKAYFQAKNYIFVYSNDQIKTYFIEGLEQMVECKGKIFIQLSQKGLFVWNDGEHNKLSASESLKNVNIKTALPYGDEILFVTMKHGLLLFDGSQLNHFSTTLDDFFMRDYIVSAYQLPNGGFAFGMSSEGLFITDKYFNVQQHLAATNGFPGGPITAITSTQDGIMWLCTNNGIISLKNNSAQTFFDENYGLETSTNDAILLKNKLYIASLSGLYVSDWDISTELKSAFTRIGPTLYVQHLDTINDILLAATNNGIKEIKDARIVKTELEGIGIRKILKLNQAQFLAATDEGLKLLEFDKKSLKNNKKWRIKNNIPGFDNECSHFELDNENFLWCSDKTKGVFKLKLTESNDSVIIVGKYTKDLKGLPDSLNNTVYKVDNEIVFSTQNGLYKYDSQKDYFYPLKNLNSLLNKRIWTALSDNKSNVWLKIQTITKNRFDKSTIIVRMINKDGKYIIDDNLLKHVPDKIYSLNQVNDSIFILGLSKGFVLHKNHITTKKLTEPAPVINKIEQIVNFDSSYVLYSDTFKDGEESFAGVQQKVRIIHLPYKKNSVGFTFSALNCIDSDFSKFSCLLDGHDKQWSKWSTENSREYFNLPEGKYIFKVKSKNIFEVESEITEYTLIIDPPVYRSIYAFVAYILAFVLIIYIIIRISARLRKKRKMKYESMLKKSMTELKQQSDEIKTQNELLLQQNEEIISQRDLVKRQHKSITDSITYASRIQNAILPPEAYIDEILPENFILYKPRDTVSGDFYWIKQVNQFIVIAVGDCTGHGVPGAIMSMLGVSLLNDIVQRRHILASNEILNHLRKEVKKSLRQSSKKSEPMDGMDIGICVCDTENNKMQYAGAFNQLYIFRNGELIVFKGDRMPIGIYLREKPTFTNHEIDLQIGDTFYMFTDGFTDQLGGP